MKKVLFFAAMFAALSMNAQGVWHATTADSKAQVNHKDKNPETGKDVTIIDAHGEVVAKKGEPTIVAQAIEGLEVTIYDGAADWEVMSNGVNEETKEVNTFVGQDSITYSKGYIQGGTNGMPGYLQHASGVSAHIELVASVKGTVYIAAKYGKNKPIWAAKVPTEKIEEEEFGYDNCAPYLVEGFSTAKQDSTNAWVADKAMYPGEDGKTLSDKEASADVYACFPLEVEPGYTYMYWVSGSKIMLSGINFVAAEVVDLFILGDIQGWNPAEGIKLEMKDGKYVFDYKADKETYFAFTTKLGADKDDWATVNANRFGPAEKDAAAVEGENTLVKGENAFKIAAGEYKMTVDLDALKLVIEKTQGVENVFAGKKVTKMIENGQLIMVIDGKKFNTMGAEL